ncbi:MAG: fasciclin domain-containing protein [Chitinophagaceae bacterium]|nr:fasciclin domain-containing protein [Chitinophagaceae bacterium]
MKAVTRATTAPGGDPTLAGTLSTARLTVFAPTNAAFTQLLGALSLTDINQIPVGTLLAVLRYHVVGGRAFFLTSQMVHCQCWRVEIRLLT